MSDIGLFDTMEDLFVNLIGALTFALIGFFRFRRENARKIAEQFIPKVTGKGATGKTDFTPSSV